MGPIGMPELIMIGIVLGLLLIPAVLVIALVIYLVKRDQNPSGPPPPFPPESRAPRQEDSINRPSDPL